MTTQIYLQTPIRVILTLFLFPMVWGIIHGLKTMGLSSELLAPIVVVFMILLLLGLLPQVEPAKLQPILETPWIKLLHSTIREQISGSEDGAKPWTEQFFANFNQGQFGMGTMQLEQNPYYQ
ncbi:GerAB/ArcD/ProY family transporter [Paenibacillus illinoisensis]|nr:GerAB/ArcD/ProY family transporter [Paenibacillus illinoisensis]